MARHELQSSELHAASSPRGGASAGPVTAEIRILLVEDVAAEAELTLRQLRKNPARLFEQIESTTNRLRNLLAGLTRAVFAATSRTIPYEDIFLNRGIFDNRRDKLHGLL